MPAPFRAREAMPAALHSRRPRQRPRPGHVETITRLMYEAPHELGAERLNAAERSEPSAELALAPGAPLALSRADEQAA